MYFNSILYKNIKLLVLTVLVFSKTLAQDAPIKFGKIDVADLQMKVYPKDTTAEAVVLGDVGRAYFDYSSSGFALIYERHRRVKILKKSGYDWATVKIPLYNSKAKTDKEEVLDLRGYTYNLENGQIIKDKLEKESIVLEKEDENNSVKRFTFPKVKEGTIVEYSYKLKSDFYYNFRDWIFQSTIPVVWSEFSSSVPEYFSYRKLMQGSEPLFINKESEGMAVFMIKTDRNSLGNMSAVTKENRWVVKDVPAIRNEPFITTINDYVSKMEFELSFTSFPGSGYKNYASSWNSINDRLIENEFFGQQLNQSGYLKEIVPSIKASTKDTLAQIELAYNHIKQTMTWNERTSLYVGTTLKKAYEAKTGNVADLNLMLVRLIRELGFDANPVILSTRDNGRILDNYVLLSKFNYVIAHVNIGGKDLFLDATASQSPMGVLPIRALNGQGRLIHKEHTRWVELNSPAKYSETVMVNVGLNPDGTAKANLEATHFGYDGIDERKKYYGQGKEKYIEAIKNKNTNWSIEKTNIENIDNANDPFVLRHELKINDFSTVAGEKIYFNPIMYGSQKENPFKNPDRRFRVDFGVLSENNFLATYTLPTGYVVEEIPKNIKISLPNDGGKFSYAIALTEKGDLSISSKILMKKTAYLIEEYDALRAFYDQIIQKHAEQIVLKKK